VKTIMAKPGQVERKWYVVDAAGKPLGRLSAGIARILMGKHNPSGHLAWIVAISLL